MGAIRKPTFIALAAVLGLGALALVVVQIRHEAEQRLAEAERRFAAEIGHRPDLRYQSQEELDAASQAQLENSMARLAAARALGDEAHDVLETGQTEVARRHLSTLAEERDKLFAGPTLVDQMLAVDLGQRVLELAEEIVRAEEQSLPEDNPQPGVPAESPPSALRPLLDDPDPRGWKGALAREAALNLLPTLLENEGFVEQVATYLQGPRSEAAILSLYIGMNDALRPEVEDVDAHIRECYLDPGGAAWLQPIATILIPNLVSIAEKRRAYLDSLEARRKKLDESN